MFRIIILMILFLISAPGIAQGPPDPDPNPTGSGNGIGGSAAMDNGFYFLLVPALLYGAFKTSGKLKKTIPPQL